MAGSTGPAITSVIQALQDRPYRFDFFQAVRWLESRRADLPRVGESHRPHDDPVRFHQQVTLGFPPSAVHSYRQTTGEASPHMWVHFLGLLGPDGPMPLAVTEYVHDRLHNHGDKTLAAFLDIFNHRMIALFYRAWARSQQTVSHDRRDDDWFADYLGSFLGVGSRPFRHRDVLPDGLKLYYSGRLSCQTRTAEGLQAILENHLGLPVVIEEFIGQWIHLSPRDRSKLGGSGSNAGLGVSLIVGARFWECQQKFRIRIGPMNQEQYRALLPGGQGLARLAAWVQFYVGDEFGWEVQLVLDRREVPAVCLGKQGHLGWSCWLNTQCPQQDADDLVLGQAVA